MNILRFIIPISCFKVTFVFLESQISGLHKDNYSTPIEGDVCQRIGKKVQAKTRYSITPIQRKSQKLTFRLHFFIFFFFFFKLSYSVPSHMRLFILDSLEHCHRRISVPLP